MSTSVFTVPAGQTAVFPAPQTSSVCVQPAATGSVTLGFGPDGIAPAFTAAVQSGNTSPFSFCPGTNVATMGNIGKIQVTATTVAATVIIADIQEYPGSFPERQTVCLSSVAYTMPSSASELELFALRFPAGFLKANFRLTVDWQLTLQNTANVKTLKCYFGPSTNSATAGAIETSAAAMTSNVYTSMAGAIGSFSVAGRNDGQTTIGSNPGLISTGGWGSSTTANVSGSSTNYMTTEQVVILTGTKATAGETFTLDSVWVRVIQ
jgi:hypothetical protein